MTKRISLLFLLFIPFLTLGQRTYLEQGDDYYEQHMYKEAIESYKKALDADVIVNKDYLLEKIAKTYKYLFEYQNAQAAYRSFILNAQPDSKEFQDYLDYAEILMNTGKYYLADSAIKNGMEARNGKYFSEYVKNGGSPGVPELMFKKTKWAREHLRDSVPVTVNQTNIETGSRSIGVTFYKKGLIYAKPQIKDFNNNTAFYDLAYIPKQNDTTFGEPTSLPGEINHKFYEGAASLTEDGKTLYYTGNATEVVKYRDKKRKKKGLQINEQGLNVLKVFTASFEDGKWVNVRELPFNSLEYDCTFPHVSDDGQTLYFCSNMPGGKGGFDMYKVEKTGDTSWSELIRLPYNTPMDEMYPYVHGDSLYFSSRGFAGYGGADIFVAPLNGHGASPRNLRQPINSSKDDFSFIVKGEWPFRTGYFSSNRVGPNGYDRIFHFRDIPPPPEVVEVPEDPPVEEEEPDTTIVEEVEEVVEPPGEEPEKVLTYEKVYFDLDKASIREESIPVLEDMVEYLKYHDNVRAEVSAHTDSRATKQYNLALSKRRAQSVINYLVKHGIDRSRLVPKGYGESKLVNKCADGVECTEAQHQQNRRVELKIL